MVRREKITGRSKFLQLAVKVLEEESHPLTASDIYDIAVDKGYYKYLESKGKTPLATLSSMLSTNSKKDGIFTASNSRPKQYSLRSRKESNVILLNNLTEIESTKKVKKAFVSMSFEDSDIGINDYVIKILKSLQIAFETGERYSKDNIPQKVETRIRKSDIFILILVKRDRIEGGGYTSPAWLLKELGIAQGDGKELIAWVEKDIKDMGGLDHEKELIYFTRDNLIDMEKATIKFLEALKEHGLI